MIEKLRMPERGDPRTIHEFVEECGHKVNEVIDELNKILKEREDEEKHLKEFGYRKKV